MILTRTIPQTQNNNEERVYIFGNGSRCIPLEKLMAIDMLNINWSLLEAEISSSCCDGNGRHGHVANIPHFLDLYNTAIESPPQGGLPPQGALFSPTKWP